MDVTWRQNNCADGHENDYFDSTTPSMLKLSFDSKGYGVKYLMFYIVDLFTLIPIYP